MSERSSGSLNERLLSEENEEVKLPEFKQLIRQEDFFEEVKERPKLLGQEQSPLEMQDFTLKKFVPGTTSTLVEKTPTAAIIGGSFTPFKRISAVVAMPSPLVGANGELARSSSSNTNQPRKSVTPILERIGSQTSQLGGSNRRDSITGAMAIKGIVPADIQSLQSQKRVEERVKKLQRKVFVYNSLENFLLFLMLLNSVIYPSATTAFYYIFTMAMTAISMVKDKKKVQLKFGLAIATLVISFMILVGKGFVLIMLNHDGEITLTNDQRLLYDSLGIRIDMTMTKIKLYTTFMTLFFDCVQCFLVLMLSILYFTMKRDVEKEYRDDDNTMYIMHPVYFERHQETLCLFALFSLAASTIFIQTIIQAFILIVLILIVHAWANDSLDKNAFRVLTLNFAQGMIIVQLSITFILQVAFVKYEMTGNDTSMVWDMFGFFLHNLKLYQVIMHLLALCFSVQAIQLFRTTRNSSLTSLGLLPEGNPAVLGGGNELDQKSERLYKSVTQRRFGASERAKTFGSAGFKSSSKQSLALDRVREKTLELRLKKNDESSFFQVAQNINYKDFSPQIFLMVCRVVAFIWCYAYHDFQSWVLLAWIMHSTVFVSIKHFFAITVTYYLPFFLLTFVFYYVINIPRVVEFETHKASLDVWLSLGMYQFAIPPLEVCFMMLSLLPFFFLIKCRKYLSFNREDQKQRFLEKLSKKDSPTLFYFLFLVITNLDMIVFIAIFFSGVNKIDFYHIFLMFFFVAYIMAPDWFKKNYIYLLYYVDFFVFEKYGYTLIDHLLPANGTIQQILDVLGLSTDYNEKSQSQYFRYVPKPQQWILIVVVFLQYQVHKLTHDEKLIEKYTDEVSSNFKTRYPRMFHVWELLQHIKKEFLILLTFIVFFVIIIFSDKNIINWGFQIIICIFIITYVGVNHTAHENGISRLQRVWFMIIWYSAFVLIVQITFQFAALPFIRKSLHLDFILNLMPLWIRKNLRLIGFQVYTDYIWQKFLIYLMYFAIGVYVKDQMIAWNIIERNSKNIEMLAQEGEEMKPLNQSNNSDNQLYFQDNQEVDWKKEFLKIRFTTPYLVYKLKKIWFIVDKCSQLIFVFISLMIMILATQWQISLSMAIHLTCFIGLCLQIASRLYKNRKGEKKALKNRNGKNEGEKYKRHLTIEECEEHWIKYKRVVNQHQVTIRQKVWFFQFVITLLCIALIYPSEFIFYVRKTFNEQRDQEELVALLDYITFYLFWVGVYHCPKQISGHGYFYNLYGYLIILILLIFEKNAQKWALDRFGCTPAAEQKFRDIEENLNRKQKKGTQAPDIPDQVIPEVENEDAEEDSIMENRRQMFKSGHQDVSESIIKNSKSNVNESYNQQDYSRMSDFERGNMTEEDLRNELKKWISKKYMLKLLSGFKILLEETIQLLLLISSVYKDSVVGLVLLFGIFLFLVRRKIKTIARLAWITGISMIIQYGLALSNLTSDNNPMDFPFPFNPYPSSPQDEGEFFIPWYRKIPLLADSFPWQVYLSMGVSNVKINTLWIDYIIMGCIQASLFYFGCQLFSIDLQVEKGDYLLRMFDRYTEMVSNKKTPEAVKKETKKLKRQVFAYNFFKAGQMTVFMHFHQITIVVTLLLSILARSLVSFGYILVCMVMIYENHKFFTPDQKNFKLQKVLKFWVQPYVFIDITMQLIFQIPIPYLHAGQDEASSWQNIIGLQDIWTEDATQVNEVTAKSIAYIIIKAFTFYFVTLQIQIFDSKAYAKYRNKDFQRFLNMAQKKGQAIMWRFNNEKIEKIKQQQNEKNKMDDMLKNLKKVLTKWQSHVNPDMDQKMQVAFDQEQMRDSFVKKASKNAMFTKRESAKDDQLIILKDKEDLMIEQVDMSKQNTLYSQKRPRKHTFLQSGTASFRENSSRSSSLPGVLDEYDFSTDKDDRIMLEKVKSKLGMFVRLYIWIKKNTTDQIVFISSDNYLMKVAGEMEKGKLNIYTKFERKILADIRDLRKKNRLTEYIDIDIKDMKRTKELVSFTKVLQAYIRLLIEIMVSYSDSVCYILMLVSMMKNAGLISLFYPLVVFGYALLEEINPKKRVWYFLMLYTELLILAKFIVQLSFWDALFTPTQLGKFQDSMNGVHVGLIRVASDAFAKMVAYFLPEILILLAIMVHIQKQIMTGSVDFKEGAKNSENIEFEGIEEALIRYVRHNELKALKDSKKIQNLEPSLSGSLNTGQINIEEASAQDLLQNINDIEQSEQNDFWKPLQKDLYSLKRNHSFHHKSTMPPLEFENIDFFMWKDGTKKERGFSLVEQGDLKKIYKALIRKELLEKFVQDEIQNRTIKQKLINGFQHIFYKNSYFEKLFPSIKEQKPGKDLYAVMATFQFIICIFMIFFYTKMDADVTNISDSLQYNQFSGQMVIGLFLQILVMIIDRYLYKSKTFIYVPEDKEGKKHKNVVKSDQVQAVTVLASIKEQKERRNIKDVLAHPERLDESTTSKIEEQMAEQRFINDNISLENTKVTLAMVSKYYLQITLLIIVHAFVFWYFPIAGNMKLQNYPYCVTKTSTTVDNTINCNEFGDNWALVIFYILYCGYFWVSSLQIKYGVAEIKKSNFLMNSYHIVNYIAFKGFMAIPFLFELKTFADWTFTKTALDVFQWFILSATHAELYIAHSLQGRYQRKPLGKPIVMASKVVLGFFGQLFIIMLIAGPLLLFSTFNPISTPNPVIDAQIQFNILIEPQGSQARNTINMFTNNYVSAIKTITDYQYGVMGFANDPKTKSFDKDLIQFVKMNNFPDTSWGVSKPNKDYLKQEFQRAVNNRSTSNLYFQLSYIFDRHNQNIPQAHNPQKFFNLSDPYFRQTLVNFSAAFGLDCSTSTNATSTINIPEFFTGVQFLNDEEKAMPASNEIWYKGLQVIYSCKDYWTVDQSLNASKPEYNLLSSKNPGIAFFTFSSKTAPSYFRYSVLTFYLSIVLVIGKLIRNVLVIGGNRIFIFEIPRAEPLLQLCECVYIYRMRQQLDKEEQLYFTFIDIMRSPEMIKAITGSSMKKKMQ